MKNHLLKNCCLLLVLCLTFCALTACSKDEGGQPASNTATTWTVTFDLGHDGQTLTQQAENESAPIQPDDPTRDGYAFTGWYADAACTSPADFEVAILADVTYYAGWEQTAATVTFALNYDGAPDATAVTVKVGDAVATPVTPERDGYLFTAWYADEACTQAYDFTAPVTGSITLYAAWEEDSGNNKKVTYMWNVEGMDVYDTVRVKTYGFATAPAPTREGYVLEGWYTDAACTVPFAFSSTRIREDVTLYAHWLKVFTFEAEHTDLTGLEGMGYSGNASGVKMIENGESRNASNGKYVGWLYNEGLTLTFHLVSDKAVDNARIALSLSAEFYDITLTSTNFTVAVNGQALNYSNIDFVGTAEMEISFALYTLDVPVALQEGENVITLSVTNTEKKTGTIYATAPMVDCIQLYSESNVTWAEGFPLDQ